MPGVAEKVREALWELAEERPDYVYDRGTRSYGPACVYSTPSGAPSCIIGHAIARVDEEAFRRLHAAEWPDSMHSVEWPSPDGSQAAYLGSARLVLRDYLGVEEDAVLYEASEVQRSQDDLVPWGDAVARGLGKGAA